MPAAAAAAVESLRAEYFLWNKFWSDFAVDSAVAVVFQNRIGRHSSEMPLAPDWRRDVSCWAL